MEILTISKIDDVFPTYSTVNKAIEAIKNKEDFDKMYAHFPEERQYPRIEARLQATCHILNGPDKHGETLNVSEGGMYLSMEHDFKLGDVFCCELQLLNRKKINALIAVMWVAGEDDHTHFYPGIGVEIEEMSKKDRKIYDQYLKEIGSTKE